jgi:hypothetical protein
MTFIDHLFDSLNAPGPNQRWLESQGNVARKGYEEMMEERAMRSPCSRRSGGSSTPSQQVVSALPGASHYRMEK